MKSFQARLEMLEALRAKRRIARLTKMQRDGGVKEVLQTLKALTPDKREEMLQVALQVCRDNRPAHIVASQEQREAAVRAAFNSFAFETSHENR